MLNYQIQTIFKGYLLFLRIFIISLKCWTVNMLYAIETPDHWNFQHVSKSNVLIENCMFSFEFTYLKKFQILLKSIKTFFLITKHKSKILTSVSKLMFFWMNIHIVWERITYHFHVRYIRKRKYGLNWVMVHHCLIIVQSSILKLIH